MAAVDISPAAALHRRAQYPTACALVYEGHEISAARLSRRTAELAAGLAERGLRRGDRVAYLGLNSVTFFETLLAAAHLGAVFVPVNFRLAAEEVRHILSDSGAHTLVVEEGHRALVESVMSDIPARIHVLVDTDPRCPAATAPAAVWTPLSELLGADRRGTEPVALYDDDLAALMYTSGTTGRPKGVMLTHGNLWWNAVNVESVVDTRPDDVNLAVAPLFHIGGLNALTLRTLVRGGTVVVRRGFDPAQCLEDLVQHRVTTLFAVPAMYSALTRVPGFAAADLSALRSAIVAGAPVPPQLIRDYDERGILLQQAWGLTETAPFASYLPAGLTAEKAGSAGAPMPYTQIRIVDPVTGAGVQDADTRGEICVRGPNVTPGYWNNPEATRAAFDDAGWFHSGDIAHRDKDGFYYIVDRLKDMIISGGENVYPAEVERVLAAYPGVLEAAVIGVPHPKWGETVLAVLTCEPGTTPTLEEVRAFTGRHLARYKLPTQVLIAEQLPRNASGKLVKSELRSWVETQRPPRHRESAMSIHTAVVPAPPDPVLGTDWTLRPLDEPATVTPQTARTYAVTEAQGGPTLLLRVHRVAHHPLHSCYPYGTHDLALGLVLPDHGPSGPALAAKLLCALVPALFLADPRCRRIVAAPDESDTVTQAALEAGGLLRVTEADLPDASVVLFAAEPPDLADMSTALDDMPH